MSKIEIEDQFVTHETNNTYEAAFYLTKGATVESVKARPVVENKRDKLGYAQAWLITLAGVPKRSITLVQEDKAQVSLSDLERNRRKLKRIIKKYLTYGYAKHS